MQSMVIYIEVLQFLNCGFSKILLVHPEQYINPILPKKISASGKFLKIFFVNVVFGHFLENFEMRFFNALLQNKLYWRLKKNFRVGVSKMDVIK